MYIQQADLFWGMSRSFVKEVMGVAKKETYQKGDFLFREGDPAAHFYILVKGHIKLTTSEAGQLVHTVDHGGEAFGWSSLVDRDVYSASAECTEKAILQKIDRRSLQKVLEEDTANGLIFFKRLAGIIGNRLIWSYKMTTSASQAQVSPTTGSGQIEESEAVV
jgi:CRP-like cAMP-binding protein